MSTISCFDQGSLNLDFDLLNEFLVYLVVGEEPTLPPPPPPAGEEDLPPPPPAGEETPLRPVKGIAR